MSTALKETVEITVPQCAPGLGAIITSPKASALIDGVKIAPAALWPDDRGWFQELFRMGTGLVANFAAETTQVSVAVSNPGIVKAFHYHRHQTDCWAPARGLFQVALADLRPDSPTFGMKNTMYIGEQRPWHVIIPPGVAHGYKIVSPDQGVLVYATDRNYDPADEGRIPFNDANLAYDWSTQYK